MSPYIKLLRTLVKSEEVKVSLCLSSLSLSHLHWIHSYFASQIFIKMWLSFLSYYVHTRFRFACSLKYVTQFIVHPNILHSRESYFLILTIALYPLSQLQEDWTGLWKKWTILLCCHQRKTLCKRNLKKNINQFRCFSVFFLKISLHEVCPCLQISWDINKHKHQILKIRFSLYFTVIVVVCRSMHFFHFVYDCKLQ